MQNTSLNCDIVHEGHLVRIGGLAVVLGLTIHIVVNVVLKEFPVENLTLPELRAYLLDQSDTWAVVHGLRYVAFLCIALFAAGLYVRTTSVGKSALNPWGIVGLLGSSMMLANLLITNGIETFTFLDFKRLSEDPALFWMLFHVTRLLWTAEIIAWGIFILGFSVAGYHSRTIPRWLAYLGFVSATAAVLSATFIVSIMNDGSASPLIGLAGLSGMAWFLCTGVIMLLRGSPKQVAKESTTV